MFLKCIEMQGFKSFADKIVLHFNKGLTSVVGPNGSGKSNISDAVRWVLGEQSAKSLRGTKMEDVIFAGTQHRKPVGFAQVTLYIDNSDKTLPLDFTEVTVSRRVYRSGESEYFINKTACRLKDIHELFMNTGVGKEGYSIIGQGRIDEILSSRSEDRRAIFEEAAGIMKYKARKSEAERKLESTKQNLLRIEDIITELGAQLEPLREQAEKARQYLELSTELKELEVSLYLDNIEKSQEKINEIDSMFQGIQQNIREENERLEKKKQENRDKTERLDMLKKNLEVLREELIELDRDTDRLDSQIRINEEKIKHIESSNTTANQDIEGSRERLAAMDADIEKRNKRLANLNRDKENFSKLLAEAEEKLAEIVARLDEGERNVEMMKQEVMDKLDDLSECRTRLNSLKNEREAFSTRKQKVEGDVRKAMLDRDRESMQLEEAQNELRRQKEALAQKKEACAGVESELLTGKKKLETLRNDQNRCIADLQASKSRRKVLKDMENSLEGYSHSVRAILQACRDNRDFGAGVHGALAQLIHVKERFETAIEVALGGALQNIVVKDEYTAKDAIRYLKEKNLGRATFLPISSVRARDLEQATLKKLEGEAGYLGTASEMIDCEPDYREIISNLLGRTVIVETVDHGITISRKYGYSFRVVTLEGEVMNPGGSMTGGSQPSKSSSLLSRSRILRELDEKIEALTASQEKLEAQCAAQVAKLQEMEENLRLKQKELQELELTVLREEHRVLGIQDNIKGHAARQEMLQAELKELEQSILSCDREIDEAGKRLSSIEDSIATLKATIEEHQLKSREEQAKRDAIHQDINDFKVSVNSVIESMEQTREAIEHLNQEKILLAETIQKRIEDKARNRERIEALQSEIVSFQEKIKGQNEIKTGKNLKLEALQAEVSALEDEVSGMVDAITSYNDTIRILQDEYNKLEVRKARLTAELEALQNRLWDEYELTCGTAAEYKKEIHNLRQTQARINELKASIRELGPVNVTAIEDYSKTKERYQFLSAQKEDLVKSEEKLNRVIHEMMSIMRRQFMEEFQKINQNFNQVFRELFDGGRAEVVLENPEDVLESGIEIIAQPPGKKLQNMMLLSGGERALTAIAILFAILKMRPAPFCILDEIEAALDDANVYKFADYIKKFTKTTQFIVITHRKGTMESSDALYGVTMQEYGVSSVISLKLDQVGNQFAG